MARALAIPPASHETAPVTEILNLAMPFFGLILLGLLATRFWDFGEEGLAWLNTFVIYFALPALIFLIIADAPFEKLTDWPFFTATTAVTGGAFIIIFLLSHIALRMPWRVAALQGTAASYGNVGYMGLPLAVAFFGPQAAVPAALVFCFDCTLQFTLTAFLVALGHGRDEDAHWAEMVLRILRQVFGHPFIIATILGVAASALDLEAPGAIGTILQMLMNAAGPCALFALGVNVGMRKFTRVGPEFPLVVAMKVVVQPLLAFVVLSFVPGLDPLWFHVALMMAALPTASNAFILASQYRAYVAGSSSAVIVTTGLSAVTLPVLILAIKSGWLP